MVVPRNLKVPNREYTIPILMSIYELTEGAYGTPTLFGSIEKPASAREIHIINRVLPKIEHLLTKFDWEDVEGEEPRWKNTVRWEIDSLFKARYIERTHRGYYKLTDTGRKAVKKNT